MNKIRKNFIIIFLLGISSGTPISLVLSTLKALMTDKGFDLAVIGFISLVSLPYSLKILVAPLVDSLAIPILTKKIGNRKSWIIFTQFLLAIFIALLGIAGDIAALSAIAALAFIVASLSATQDIVIDAYRIEIISKEDQSIASGYYIYGYRLGMLISGSLALILSDFMAWTQVYMLMSLFMILGIFATLFAQESRVNWRSKKYNFYVWFKKFIFSPLSDFMERKNWLGILLFIVLFKLADAFVGSLTVPFLLDLKFTKTEIATVVKTFGLFATLIGVYCGGLLSKKISINYLLGIAIILQGISNLFFLLLSITGKDVNILYLVIFVENFCGGMGDVIFVGYLSSICNLKFSATQYALLTSLASVARSVLSSSSGLYAKAMGWSSFFVFSSFLAIPAIAFLIILNNNSKKDKKKTLFINNNA